MATPPQLTHLSFAAGLDESQVPEVQDPLTSFPVRQNVRQDKRGGATKRRGYGGLTTGRIDGTTRTAGRKLFAHNGVPSIIDGSLLDSYIQSASASATRSRVPECVYRLYDLPPPPQGSIVGVLDTEYGAGYVAVAYGYTAGGISPTTAPSVICLMEAETNALVLSPFVLPLPVVQVCLASFGDQYFIAFCQEESGGAPITVYLLDTQDLASDWTLIHTISATPNYNISCCSLDDRAALIHGDSTGGVNTIKVRTYNQTGVLQTATIPADSNEQTNRGMDIHGSSAGVLWATWSIGGPNIGIYAQGFTPTNLASVTATAARIVTVTSLPAYGWLRICEAATSGRARLLYRGADATDEYAGFVDVQTTAGAAAVSGSVVACYGARLASRPFRVGTRFYAAFSESNDFDDGQQGVHVVADWSESDGYLRPIANIAPNLVPGRPLSNKFSYAGDNVWFHAVQILKSGSIASYRDFFSFGQAGSIGAVLAELDFYSFERWETAEHSGATYLGGGVLSIFTGDIVTEAGFVHAPIKPDVDVIVGTLTGAYRWLVTWEDVDMLGNVAVSGVGEPSDEVTLAAEGAEVTINPMNLTARGPRGALRAVLWRTLAGQELPFFRAATLENTPGAMMTFTDDALDDATLSARPVLYSNLPGGVGQALDRRAPPGLTHITSYNGMLVGSLSETLYWSGQEIFGEATWFSPLFQLPISEGGDVTAIESQDGTLYVFKRDAIYAISGEAPSDNGTAGGLGFPRKLACDVGCVAASSVVPTSLGIFFQSARGIELLSRGGGAVTWVGEKAQRTLAEYQVVTSAVLDDVQGLVRFSLATQLSQGAAAGPGRDLVYDIVLQDWVSVDVKTGATSQESTQSACMSKISGQWVYSWLGANGVVYRDKSVIDADSHLDGTTWVTMAAETGSFKLGGLQGRQQLNRLLVLARKASDHNLSVSLAYNYEETFRTARTFTRAEINSLLTSGWPITQLKHEPHDDAEGQSVRLRLEDAAPTGGSVNSGEGATWIGLTLDITPKPGVFEVPEEAA